MFQFKRFQLKSSVLLLTAFTLTFGDLTIHILNPWANDPVRATTPVYIQSSESGWYPGIQMSYDFGDWLMYTFKSTSTTTNDRVEFMSVIPSANDQYADKQYYKGGPSQIVLKPSLQAMKMQLIYG
jgi:hypothetical protein